MMELTTYGNYQEYKTALDNELKAASEGFVRIGYLLRQAMDTDILKGSGYSNVNEFAKAEYNLDKTQVSRFININIRFSQDGNSPYLQESFRGIGYAKLALMLQLPEEINAEITPEYSKTEIQAIKEEVEEERKITDLEVLMEGQNEEQALLESNLLRVLHQMGEDEPELYVRLHGCALVAGLEALKDTLAPDGEKIYIVRIRGLGRKMLSLKTVEGTVTLIDIRSNERESYTWEELIVYVRMLMKDGMTAAESWESVYHQAFPQKEKIAPVQPTKGETPAPRKEKKVQKAKVKEPKKTGEARNEQKETEEKSSGAAVGMPEREDFDYLSGTKTDSGSEGGACREPRDLPEGTGTDTSAGQQDTEACSGETDGENSGGFCSAEPGEPPEPGSEKTHEPIDAMEQALREEAESLADGVREVFWGWNGQLLPVGELLQAEKNARKLLAVITELLRMKREMQQLEGQMSIEDVIGTDE